MKTCFFHSIGTDTSRFINATHHIRWKTHRFHYGFVHTTPTQAQVHGFGFSKNRRYPYPSSGSCRCSVRKGHRLARKPRAACLPCEAKPHKPVKACEAVGQPSVPVDLLLRSEVSTCTFGATTTATPPPKVGLFSLAMAACMATTSA